MSEQRERHEPPRIHFTVDEVVACARLLRSDDGENPEYDRALVELVRDLVVGVTGWEREQVEHQVLGGRASFYDPPHYRDDDAPCHWCGATWERTHPAGIATTHHLQTQRLGSLTMRHQEDCPFIRWQDKQQEALS